MIVQTTCPHCGHRQNTSEAGYIRCEYCNHLYKLVEPVGPYSSKMLPKYKLIELGENPIDYGFKGA